MAAVPVLVLIVTFLFWYQTWFGRQLSDSEIGEYLTDTSMPHKTQHALSQLADRMIRGDTSAKRWYPQVVSLAKSPASGMRVTAAWVMGQDNKVEEFHQVLREMIRDPDSMVRRNAALALVRFGDASGREELGQMLRPQTLTAPSAGTISFHLKEADPVRNGSIVARIKQGEAKPADVMSSLEGQVERRLVAEGESVVAGQPVAILSPGEEQVRESLRALALVGTEEDLSDVERFVRQPTDMSDRVQQQAALTVRAIRERARSPIP